MAERNKELMPHYANVYEVDRVYGGPEEGGWWVTTYTPMASHKCRTKAGARFKLDRLTQKYNKIEPEWGLHSVNYNGGIFSFGVEDKEADFYPQGRIHYA